MFMNRFLPVTISAILLVFTVPSCKKGQDATESFNVNVRMPLEPESLHPMFSKSSFAIQIASLILLPIAEYDPVTLQLSPLLITSIPTSEKVSDGKHS